MSLWINRADLRRTGWKLLERLEDLADRAGELIGALGLAALSAAVLLEGALEVLAVLFALSAAVLLAVLPRVRGFLEELRPRLVGWYLNRS